MNDLLQFATSILWFLIDLFTLAMVGGIFWIIGVALLTMARNRQPRWDSILFTTIIMMVAIWLIQWYPRQVLSSVRTSLQESRPEAQQLRDELREWLPEFSGPGNVIVGVPTITAVELPAATPTPGASVQPTAPPTATPTPGVTATPLIVLLPTPIPAATAAPTLDMAIWNVMTPPPTPELSK